MHREGAVVLGQGTCVECEYSQRGVRGSSSGVLFLFLLLFAHPSFISVSSGMDGGGFGGMNRMGGELQSII